jgi:hypothetical protein
MKRLFLAIALLTASVAFGQVNLLTQTTASLAIAVTDQSINVASATGINAPNAGTGVIGTQLYVISPGNPRGETMIVRSVTSTTIGVRRGAAGVRSQFPSGSVILIGQPNWFYQFDPNGGCTLTATYVGPWVNTVTGSQSLCSTVSNTWVPSWNSPMGDGFSVTATVASAAALLPSGPLFDVSGTTAITSFTIPLGFASGTFCMVPTGIFTTTATNNIAVASTAVVGKILCETWDAGQAKFIASY